MQAKTFDEWKSAGFVVNKGQKATGRNAAGKATFTSDQVKQAYFGDEDGDPDDPYEIWARGEFMYD